MSYIQKICPNCGYGINQSEKSDSYHWCDDGNKYEMIPDPDSLSNKNKGIVE